jgi:O-antigen ligase
VINGTLSVFAGLAFVVSAHWRPAPRLDWQWIALLSAGTLAVILWGLFQLTPGTGALETMPPASKTISLNRAASWAAVLQTATLVLVFITSIGIGVSSRKGRFLLQLIVAVSFAIAVYGLVCRFSGFKQVFLLPDVAYPGVLTGTFVNRNTAAAYFAIGIACCASLLAEHLQLRIRQLGDRLSGWRLAITSFQGAGLYLFAVLVIAAATIDTASRAGTTVAVVAFLAVTFIASYGLGSRHASRTTMILVGIGGLIVLVAVAGDRLLLRLDHIGFEDESRLAVYADTIGMIGARPILGFGIGAFAEAYPLFHSSNVPSDIVWNRAHNTYLQTAAELGLVAVFVVVALCGAVLSKMLGAIRTRTESTLLINAALGTSVALALHSLIDFSVQIQAVALTAAALLGAATGEAMRLTHARQAIASTAPPSREHERAPPAETIYVDHSSIKSGSGE